MRRTAVLLLAVALVATACQWRMGRHDAGRTGVSTAEQPFDVTTVDQLEPAWFAPIGYATTGDGTPKATPLLVGGRAYVTDGDGIAVFDADGVDGCSGTPVPTCAPLWRYQATGGVSLEPAIADGRLYVPTHASPEATIEVFDAEGIEGCAGTPTVCQPLWSVPLGGFGTNGVTVAQGLVLASVYGVGLVAADATGTTGCSADPVPVCQPLWRGDQEVSWSEAPAVADGRAYTTTWSWTPESGDASRVLGYDLSPTGCSSDPVPVCQPTWRSHPQPHAAAPAIRDGLLVAFGDGGVLAYDPADPTGCDADGCPPIWTGPVTAAGPVALDGTQVLVGGHPLAAFPATGCTPPGPCAPTWVSDAPVGSDRTAPTVAGGVLFGGGEAGTLRAYDAAGVEGCTGTAPATCAALWVGTPGDVTPSPETLDVGPPAVAGGTVAVTVGDDSTAPHRYVVAYRLP